MFFGKSIKSGHIRQKVRNPFEFDGVCSGNPTNLALWRRASKQRAARQRAARQTAEAEDRGQRTEDRGQRAQDRGRGQDFSERWMRSESQHGRKLRLMILFPSQTEAKRRLRGSYYIPRPTANLLNIEHPKSWRDTEQGGRSRGERAREHELQAEGRVQRRRVLGGLRRAPTLTPRGARSTD